MARYVLDTNHASPLVTLNHPLRQHILRQLEDGDHFSLCIPVITETLFGLQLLPRATQNVAERKRLRALVPCHIAEELDAELAASLQARLRKSGWQLETVDALIATIALRNNLILLTTDKDFRAVPNLRYENWLAV